VTRQEALDLILSELDRACAKFPMWQTDGIQAAAVVSEEAGELVKAVNEMTFEPQKTSLQEVRDEAVQTAAMALRFLLSLGKYEWKPGGWHKQEEDK